MKYIAVLALVLSCSPVFAMASGWNAPYLKVSPARRELMLRTPKFLYPGRERPPRREKIQTPPAMLSHLARAPAK